MSAAVNRVLVLADEPLIAALVGMLVEIAGRTPVFADPGEVATDALVRTRPVAVVLVDVRFASALSDLFFSAAARSGAGVAVFGPDVQARPIAEIAAARRIPWLTLPVTREGFREALQRSTGRSEGGIDHSRSRQPQRQGNRRATAEALTTSDGTTILVDDAGRRWMVYDRRTSGDRRAAQAGGTERAVTRIFVCETGEARQCGLDETESSVPSLALLEAQLARSGPH